VFTLKVGLETVFRVIDGQVKVTETDNRRNCSVDNGSSVSFITVSRDVCKKPIGSEFMIFGMGTDL
jgi:hypothetical protein